MKTKVPKVRWVEFKQVLMFGKASVLPSLKFRQPGLVFDSNAAIHDHGRHTGGMSGRLNTTLDSQETTINQEL